ncbi:MAG: type II secretion system protein GspJ, partial [Pseudomonas sp.]|nr:type II secretion system protein GspJ [Pseudomonas sp.]
CRAQQHGTTAGPAQLAEGGGDDRTRCFAGPEFSPKPGCRAVPDKLEVRRVNWRNPLGLPRSEVQDVSYQLKDGVLWRFSRGLEEGAQLQQQKLLGDVREVRWRLFNRKTGWHSAGASAPKTAQHALELNLSVGRFDGVRRVLLLTGGT